MKKRLIYLLSLSGIVLVVTGTSCETPDEEQNLIDEEVFDPNSRIHGRFDNKIFSIPSPVQTAYLVKRLDLKFDGSLLNDEVKANEYVTEYQQALNLGIYGADLGYAALYEEKGTTIKYLSAIQKLTTQLGLDGAFDTSFFQRFEKYGTAGDSMIYLMTDAFKQADFFLKESQRKPVTALILTGGWIESLHFACELNKRQSSPEIKRRIAEQKRSLVSIVNILEEYNPQKLNDELIISLKDLSDSFEKIETTYSYNAPDTDAENHMTTFNHTMEVTISDGLISEIYKKVSKIRAAIINT